MIISWISLKEIKRKYTSAYSIDLNHLLFSYLNQCYSHLLYMDCTPMIGQIGLGESGRICCYFPD